MNLFSRRFQSVWFSNTPTLFKYQCNKGTLNNVNLNISLTTPSINLLDGFHCLKYFSHVSGVDSTPVFRWGFVVKTTVFILFFIILVVLPWPGFEPANFFVRQFFGVLVRNANHSTAKGPRIVNFYSTYVSRHNFFLFISGLIIGSHIGLMSMLGWLIIWTVQRMKADSLGFLVLEFSSLLIMLVLSHWNLCCCSHECSAILDLSISPFVVFHLCSFTLVCKGLHVSPMYRFRHSHGML